MKVWVATATTTYGVEEPEVYTAVGTTKEVAEAALKASLQEIAADFEDGSATDLLEEVCFAPTVQVELHEAHKPT